MKNHTFAVVINVKNLQVCRAFYAELPGFGAPVMESSFAVVFRPTEAMDVVLVKSAAQYLEHASSATAWAFEVADLEAFRTQLAECDMPLEAEEFPVGCSRCFRGADPEGNLFYVRQR